MVAQHRWWSYVQPCGECRPIFRRDHRGNSDGFQYNPGQNNWEFEFQATNSLGSSTNSLPATLTVIAAPPLSGSYSTSVLALNPVAYWPLNETYADPFAGGELAYDASGNNFDGLYLPNAENGFPEYGIVGPQPADGYPQFTVGQGALDIPVGSFPNSWVTTPALNLNTNTVTILMWVYPSIDEAPATGLLFNRNSGTVGGMCYSTTNTLGYTWNNNDSATYNYVSGRQFQLISGRSWLWSSLRPAHRSTC